MSITTETKVKCHSCGHEVKESEAFEITHDKSYCEDCVRNCDNCNDFTPRDELHETSDGFVCEGCYESYRECGACGGFFHEDSDAWNNGENGDCEECSGGSFPYKDWHRNKKLEDGKTGKILQSTRLFGLENELRFVNNRAIHKIVEYSDDIGITADSGAEIQTPPASGDKAEKLITDLAAIYKEHGFSCRDGQGLHIHVDAHELKTMTSEDRFKRIQALWLFYIVFDEVFISLIPKYRQRNANANNMYGKNTFAFSQIEGLMNETELEKTWYGFAGRNESEVLEHIKRIKGAQKDGSRYKGFNLHALLHDFHLEIRYHESTTSDKAMLEWANLHCLIMDKAVNGEITLDWLRTANKRRLKRRVMFEFLNLSKSSRLYFRKRTKLCAD